MTIVKVEKPKNYKQRSLRLAVVALSYFGVAWAFHGGAVNPFTNLIGGYDGYIHGFPSKVFASTFSSWNPYLQAGKFVYADVLYQSFYPPAFLILSILPKTFGFNLFLIVHYALCGLSLYLYLGSLRLTQYSALIGGLIFMLCGFVTAHKGHEMMICVAAWLPLTLYFIQRYAEAQRNMDLGLGAVSFSLGILAGFPQLTVYSGLLLVAYLPFCVAGSPLLRGWKTKLAHIAFAGAVILGIGVLLSCLPLFSVAETLPSWTRERISFEMFSQYSFELYALFTFFIPNLFGGVDPDIISYAPNPDWVEWYPYLGLLPIALALAGLAIWRTASRELRFWIPVTAAALLLSFGATTPIYRLLYYVPVYNLFRCAGRHLLEVNLGLSVIAAFGLDFLLKQPKTSGPDRALFVRRIVIRFSLLFGSAILVATILRSLAQGSFARFCPIPDSTVINPSYTFATAKPFILRNLSWSSPTMLMPLLFFGLTLGTLASLVWSRSRPVAMLAIPLLIVFDTFLASHQIYPNPSTLPLFQRSESPELAFLSARKFDSTHFRIFPLDFPSEVSGRRTIYPLLNLFYHLPVINDYGPFWLKRYQAVTGFNLDGAMPSENLQNYKILSLLGTRYLMAVSPESIRSVEQATLDGPEIDGESLVRPGADIWLAYGASKTNGNGFILKKPANEKASVIQTEIPLRPNNRYEISFLSQTDADLSETPCYIDLFALPSYFSAETTRLLFKLAHQPCRYRVVINSGPTAPARGFVRVYTQSVWPIEVRDLQVKELGGDNDKAFRFVTTTLNGVAIFENPNALPRFRFAHRVVPALSLDDAICQMRQPEFDPADQAIVEGIESGGVAAPGRLISERLEDTKMEWEVETSGRSFLVVADSFFPDWIATVDGNPATIYPVYGCLRGLWVPTSGRHHVEMRFAPRTLYAGLGATGIGLLFLGILFFRDRKALAPPKSYGSGER